MAAAAGVKNREQVGMSEMSRALPEANLHFGSGRSGGNQLEHRPLARGIRKLRQKYSVEFRACKALTENEFPVNQLAFPFFPLFAHSAPHAK
jgi:hypothetical protein